MQTKRILLSVVKIVISLGLIIFLLVKISPSRLIPVLKAMDPAYLAAALILFFASSLLGSVQWHMLLRAGGITLPFGTTFRLYFVGLFFNNFMLGNLGGDAVKIYDVSRDGNDPYQVFAITLLDRVIGITGLCILALAASFVLLPTGIVNYVPVYIVIFAGCIAPALSLVLNKRLSGWIRNRFGRIRVLRLGERFDSVFGHLGGFRSLRSLLVKLVLLALVVQSLRVAVHAVVGAALGVELTPRFLICFYVFVPLLGLIVALPISIGGLGVREWFAILLFTQIGYHDEQILLMELLTWFAMVAVSIAGWLFFMQRQFKWGKKEYTR